MPRSEYSTPSSLSLIRSSRANSNPYPKPKPSTSSNAHTAQTSTPSNPVKQEYFTDNTSDLVPSSSPSLSASEEDPSSEFEPTVDEKPSLGDVHSESESDRPKKRVKHHNNTPKKKGSSKGSVCGTPRKNGSGSTGRGWTGEEDWRLFSQLHPRVGKPDWMGVASKVGNGRDSKSCQNRYALISRKLEGVIKSIGGA
ncbi:hypothetical protein I302_100770 [Kwoniella bestiolae CBS 10118]|uniref:Myb-like domain-containing protein n=1 Tax=Kwoniella bestiolae CBS 10118 TaxID=1296100 RepID=A0AAJ8M4T4_9TREE